MLYGFFGFSRKPPPFFHVRQIVASLQRHLGCKAFDRNKKAYKKKRYHNEQQMADINTRHSRGASYTYALDTRRNAQSDDPTASDARRRNHPLRYVGTTKRIRPLEGPARHQIIQQFS